MANNRLYLKCRCGETMCVAKYWGGGQWEVREPVPERLEAWLNRHGQECLEVFGDRLEDFEREGTFFELRTEVTADAPHSNPLPAIEKPKE